VNANAEGPAAGEHEKQHPEAAAGGQGTAAEHKPDGQPNISSENESESESENEDEDQNEDGEAPLEKPTAPGPPAAKPPPPKEVPANPPKGAAPEAPPPAKPATKTEAAAPPDPGKGSEKRP
jgi:hypothetical protein